MASYRVSRMYGGTTKLYFRRKTHTRWNCWTFDPSKSDLFASRREAFEAVARDCDSSFTFNVEPVPETSNV